MKRKCEGAVFCTLSAVGISMLMSATAMADGSTDIISIPYMQEGAWEEVAMVNDDTVSTGANIRGTADENGEIIGYLYRGCAAWVINKGEEWTELYSGGLTGFVKNEYLLYGSDVTGLADYYGIEGVATTWDGVKVFADQDEGSKIVDELKTGESFPLLQNNGHWLQIQYGADSVAYVSSEDVTDVMLLATAANKDGEFEGLTALTAVGGTEAAYTEPAYSETEPTYTETEPTYTETEPTYTETEPTYTETEATQTEAVQTETTAPETDAAVDDTTSDDTTADDGSSSDLGADGYYDADTDTYYDGSGNVVTGSNYSAVETETYVEETNTVEAVQTYVEETEAYVEETQAYAAETEAASAQVASTDDTSLLAALIYCEAGNQSYEGMVAVGAVVMNRVYSSSFPNTISEVIYQSGQFTPAYSGGLAGALASGVPSTCYDAAAAAIAGENPVGSALYFNTGSGKGTKIGDHQFY